MTLSQPLTGALDNLVSQLVASATRAPGTIQPTVFAGCQGFTQAQATALVKRGLAALDGTRYRVTGKGLALRADRVEAKCAAAVAHGEARILSADKLTSDVRRQRQWGQGDRYIQGAATVRLMLALVQSA